MKLGMVLLLVGAMAAFGQDAPVPDANGVYRTGHGVSNPKPIRTVNPEYSEEARRKKFSGTCVITLTVDVQGVPQDVHVERSIAEGLSKKLRKAALSLDEKAVEAVEQYRFEPGMLDGKAVPVSLKVEVNFQIN